MKQPLVKIILLMIVYAFGIVGLYDAYFDFDTIQIGASLSLIVICTYMVYEMIT